jgi:hypothetical protein
MPKKLERELKAEAKKKGLSGDRADAYTYGTLRKTGWKPEQEKKSSGKSGRYTSRGKG